MSRRIITTNIIKTLSKIGMIALLCIFIFTGLCFASNIASDIGKEGTVKKGGVNLRTTMGGKHFAQLKKNTVVQIFDDRLDRFKNRWYGIIVKNTNQRGYVLAEYVNPSNTIFANNAVVPAVPNLTNSNSNTNLMPNQNALGVLITTVGGVNLRDKPNGFVVDHVDRNMTYNFYEKRTIGKYTWYKILNPKSGYCYIRSDCVKEIGQANVPVAPNPNAPISVPINSKYGTITLILDKVHLRNAPNSNAASLGMLSINTILPLNSSPRRNQGYTWYPVTTAIGRGYIRDDCAKMLSAASNPSVPAVGPFGSVKINLSSVNIRKTPEIDGVRLGIALQDQTLPVSEKPIFNQGYAWYKITNLENIVGYVRGDNVQYSGNSGVAPTVAPTAMPNQNFGTVQIKLKNVNLRNAPSGKTVGTVNINSVFKVLSQPVSIGAYTWYHIDSNGLQGYVRSDCVTYNAQGNIVNTPVAPVVTPIAPVATPIAPIVPVVTPIPNVPIGGTYITNNLITIVNGVNLRQSPSTTSNSLGQIPINTVLPYTREMYVGTTKWFKVRYNNIDAWVLGDTVTISNMPVTPIAPINTARPITPVAPTINPSLPNVTAAPIANTVGNIKTTKGNVNIRNAPGGKSIGSIKASGTVLPYYGIESTHRYTWYKISYNNTFAYIRSDVVVDVNGNTNINNGTANNQNNVTQLSGINRTMRLGDSGNDVKIVQQELKNRSYYKGNVNGKYTREFHNAVKKFQKDNMLSVDGSIGPNTLAVLRGSSNNTNVSNNSNIGRDGFEMHYPVKKVDWWSGTINKVWPKGKNAQIKDVKTGIVFWVHRWAGGSHVDGEPLTAADTAKVCQIYGVKSASEIKVKNLWQRRPLWVTVGGNTYAASLYGVPHNLPGDSVKNNNFEGQFCVHFSNSKTHGSNVVDRYHEQAIDYAWKKGQSPNSK